ncbi:hypothetical protein D9757_012175 [Collybiopsis confluens]|uniref:SET domain-containing protein n=1 Tax=Collybiopsis confluens TaxID=2823264 RepID=A0A8H5GK73_9AGAR|nr:hypothetical protein D9757_013830 [Collybiopsis confluens]KAF5366513.1 hypothetical protein D9757_012175 [Collybiopsis confluens]
MSFSDLKSARNNKSYVKSSVNCPTSSTSGEPVESGLEQNAENVEPKATQDRLSFEEGMYSSLPSSVEIRRSTSNGRGIWTLRPIRAGESIIVTKAFAASLSNQNLPSYCSSCFAPADPNGMQRCTKCRAAYYCDSICQTNDWAIHKHECSSLQQWFQAAPSKDILPPSDAVRCLSRMVWKRQRKGPGSVQAKEIANMQSNRSSLKPSAYETHTYLAHSLVQFLGLTNPAEMAEYGLASAADLVDLISRFVTNTFSVTDPALTALGAAVSPVIALINHSCEPNAAVIFPRATADSKSQEPSMQVIAIRDIYPQEEILTSYIDTTLPTDLRQAALQETYNFTCTCSLCTSSADPDPRQAMNCPKNCGGLCPLPLDEDSLIRCIKCNALVKSVDAMLDALRVGQEGLDKATKLQNIDFAKSIQLTSNLMPILTSAGLIPSSHPLLGLSRLHQSLLTASFPSPPTQDHLDETIRTATKNVAGLGAILHEGHPVLAIAVAELGKLLAVDEPSPRANPNVGPPAQMMYPPSGFPRLKLAYETLLRARKMLLIGFGVVNEGGEVGKGIREMIVGLEKEMDVFSQGVRNVVEDTPKGKKR